jgi:SAM-dependent methyltransferase
MKNSGVAPPPTPQTERTTGAAITTTSPSSARTPLWQLLWRRPLFKRAFYEALGLVLWRHDAFEMLNCGFLDAREPRLPLPAANEKSRLGCQLYERLVRATPLRDLDVLEIGCGRGAGACFLEQHCAPKTIIGTDAARTLSWAARRIARRAGAKRARFVRAAATRLPFADASFDVALSVESAHALMDKAAFLGEAARVLRERGRLLVADFFYTRETSSHATQRFRDAVARSCFRVESEEDWTTETTAALEAQSPRRHATIARLPRGLRGAALTFAGTTQSPLYRQLRDGRATYRFFALVKR